MKVFSTTYNVGNIAYSSFVYAKDRKIATAYVLARGIGESITGQLLISKSFDPCPLPSLYYSERKLLKCIHLLTFYGWIAGHFINVHHELLRDDGVLHDIIHEMEHPHESCFRPLLFKRLRDLEQIIPGLKTYDPKIFTKL